METKKGREKRLADREWRNLNLVINASPEVILEIHLALVWHGLTSRSFEITDRNGTRQVINTGQDGYEPRK